MSNIDYASTNEEELKRYFLEHRTDEAFDAYMDRLNARPKKVIIEAGELDHLPLEEQIKITAQRMRVHFGHKLDPRT